ncbi:MAG: VCBS repeat-containing protein [Leeuwenhoekiella sp.]
MSKRLIYILIILLTISCEKQYKLSGLNPEKEELFTKLNQDETGLTFSNNLPEDLKFNGLQYEYYYNGSGLAVADFNNDGLKDVFFVSALRQHKLFLNQGDLQFDDVTDYTGIIDDNRFSGGVAVVDINNDGWMDIYISNSGKFKRADNRRNKLYINLGIGEKGIPKFEEQGEKYGLDLADCSTQATFFDYDKDGDLDIYLLNHYPSSYPGDKSIAELLEMDGDVANDRLLRNDNNHFTDVSDKAGIIQNRLEYGLGVAVGDVNNDGWPDLYVSNDYTGKDHLYMNNKNGTFTDRILEATNHISFFAMGNDIADINNDGWLDVMTVDMMGESNYDIKTSMSGMNPANFQEAVDLGLHHQYMYNSLQLNSGLLNENGVPLFSDIAQIAGVSKTDWSWAPLFFDMDNDGLKDLFISNGIKRDFRNNDFVNYVNKKQDSIHKKQKIDVKSYVIDILDKMPLRKKENYFFKNEGDLHFEKMNSVWGDGSLTSSNGAVYADLDNDGDLDIVVNNTDDPAFVLRNNSKELSLGHYIAFKLKGSENNIDGVGARIIVTTKDSRQVQELYFTRGFISSMARELHFGIGTSTKANVEVIWPDNKYQRIDNLKADKLINLEYENAQSVTSPGILTTNNNSVFEKEDSPIKYVHTENVYDDYERESLLPHKMSQEGPSLAVGDVNGDMLDDMHIGGAMGSPGVLYIQNNDGTFNSTNTTLFQKDSEFEDVASTFFDADGDGDLDLYVVSGGNENDEESPLLRDRLYINNGKGDFNFSPDILPKIAISGSCVKVADYDNDGDLDLFIGGRQVPGKYPAPAKSYLLQNNSSNGNIKFEEADNSINDKWQKAGMVTDALWIDLNHDKYLDLVITGEWMPIRVFENIGGKDFEEKTNEYGLNDTNGWWFSLAAMDVDQNGEMDIIAGNLGLNFKYKASVESPFEVYAADFDNTGSNDIVLSYYENKELVPLRGRQCSSQQMPFIKDKFPTYDAFGKAVITDIFNEKQLEKSVHLKAKTFATTIFKHIGGSFKPYAFPNEAQISSVNSILIEDFDHDGNKDILLTGNLYGTEVETPRADASHGLVLKGDGRGDFLPLTATESGLMIMGEVKSTQGIKIHGKRKVIFARNNNSLEILGFRDGI